MEIDLKNGLILLESEISLQSEHRKRMEDEIRQSLRKGDVVVIPYPLRIRAFLRDGEMRFSYETELKEISRLLKECERQNDEKINLLKRVVIRSL